MISELIILSILSIENDEDQKFMTDLYIQYYPLMKKKVFLYVKNNEYVDDIIHDAYIKLIEKISLLKTFERYVLTSYVSSTIENAAINFVKKDNTKYKLMFTYEDDNNIEFEPDMETPESLFFERVEKEKIHNAIDRLPNKYRLILQYKYFQNMSDKEIASNFGIKSESVREYLTRARRMAYKILKEEGNLNE